MMTITTMMDINNPLNDPNNNYYNSQQKQQHQIRQRNYYLSKYNSFRWRLTGTNSTSLVSQFVILLVFLLQISIVAGSVSYMVTIAPYDESCYLLSFPVREWTQSYRLIGNYELISSSTTGDDVTAEPLLAYVMRVDDTESILWSQVGATHGNFDIVIPHGPNAYKRYWFCIQNSSHRPDAQHEEAPHPDLQDRTIGFNYNLIPNTDPDLATPLQHQLTWDEQNVVEWNERSREIQNDLRHLVDHHQYVKVREIEHRAIVERTFEHVLEWTLFEALMVILVAVGQVLYVRRFLENKRYFK